MDSSLDPERLAITRLEGEDRLSACFLYRVDAVTEEADPAVDALLGMPVTLWMHDNDPDRRRPIHGHVRRIVGQGRDHHGHRRFQMEVVPRLWFLSCTSDCRIFQNQSIPDILSTVFQDQDLVNVEFRVVRGDYKPVEYCVQYQESALDFVSRLMEHLGLFYWHEHTANKHTLMIGDRNAATGVCVPATVSVSRSKDFDSLREMNVDCSFRPGKWTLNDYDFESPTRQLLVDTPTTLDVPRIVKHEMYEYPGYYNDRETGRLLTRTRVELEESRHRRVFGTGYCSGFDPGRQVTITAEPDGRGVRYLLTEVRHRAFGPGLDTSDVVDVEYSNEYVAIPANVPFRPERVTPRPYMRGAQTATVTGPSGEAIHCDQYGRVHVQFHWDRQGKRDDRSSCWIRVAQARAGSHYGDQVLPHVGHKLVVSFLEGDPDRPLITGNVPNALTMPPMSLPADKHKTIQRDHGDNKIVMHGKAGEESLSVMSPRVVNVFASGKSARPLSADTVTFESDPKAGGGSSGAPGAISAAIPTFLDPVGLGELRGQWFGTVQSDIGASVPPSVGQPATQGQYGKQDGSTAGSYLNWGSEGKINCLVMDNNNLWVYKNSYGWINGDSVTQINGNSTTVIGGTAYGGTNTSVISKSEVWGKADSLVHGDSSSVVNGKSDSWVLKDSSSTVNLNSVSYIGGSSTSTVIGPNLSDTYGPTVTHAWGGAAAFVAMHNVTFSYGLTVSVFGGVNISSTSGFNIQTSGGTVTNTGLEIYTNPGMKISTVSAANIKTAILHLIL